MINYVSIREAFDMYGTDKGRDHCYEHMYAEVFSNNNINSLLEIGVREGKSMAAWRHLFPSIHLTGVDIYSPSDKFISTSKFDFVLCDSTSPTLCTLLDDKYDIIIDDGSHYCIDQINTFKNLADKFNTYYVIEDIYHYLDSRACEKIEMVARELGFVNIKRYKSCHRNLKNTYAMVIQV